MMKYLMIDNFAWHIKTKISLNRQFSFKQFKKLGIEIPA